MPQSPARRTRRLPAPGLAGLTLAAMTGCGWSGVAFPDGPPPAPGSPPAEVSPTMSHEVRYHVFCHRCEVTYTAGTELKTVETEGSWSTTVRLESPSANFVTLRASPTAGAIVRRATIYIDGNRVAEAEREVRSPAGDDVMLTAPLPSTPGRTAGVRIR